MRWRDAALAAPLDLAVAPLSLDARELSIPDLSRPAVATGRARVEAVVDGEARATAALALDGARARVEAALSGVDAARYAPLAGPVLAARIEQGRLEARATLDWDGEARTWRIGDGGAELAGLRVTHPETKPAGVARIAVSGVSVDGAQRRVELGALAVEGATLDVRRDAQGRIDLQSWIGASDRAAPAASGAPAAPATPAAVATSATSAPPAPPAALAAPAIPATPSASPLVPDVAATEPAPPWTLLARSVSVTGLDLGYTDVRIARDRALPRIALTARASDVTLDPRRPTAFEANATLADGSRLGARGTLRPEPLALDAQVRLQRVVLTHADPYLSPYLNVSVASGQLWGAGRLVVDAAAGAAAPRVRFDGEASINEFRAIDEATSDDFLRWGALALPSVKVDWRADRPGDSLVDIGPVAFVDFYSRIILSPQGRLNLGSVVADPDRPAGATSVTAVPGTPGAGRAAARAGERTVADVPPRAGRAGPRPTIRIGTVRIASGNVDFTDLFIRPNYSANLTGLVGSIDPIASDRAEPADVLVTGRVDDDTPLEIVGKIDPLSERRLVDLRAIARGFDLPKLSPYSGRWAGYAIEKGKLTADVRYRIEGDRLTAENKLVINQLTFGDRVESADATSLPVRLAVSLLKDRNGNIDLDLPISGTISDPQFSVGSLIWKAIGNVVTRVVASPFSFLASLGSVPDVELGHVAFAAGGAELDDEDRGRLDALAKAMQARPELSLEIAGVADPSADREAMQRERLERTLKVAKLAEMRRADPAAELPALREVTLDAVERAGLLERAWRDAKLDAGAAGKVPAPAELERLLIERSTVAGEDVRQIAQQRAQAARDYLHEERGIASDRLYLLAPRVAAPGDALPPMRADFSVTAR
ncbi:MAG TPA: DUF748 domain-containing protein [Burkholderiaceae bacterium]|nr:DUF748 domain-containing protein [Burkholderiaceae bacterium]